jgi:prephenate dehydratase
MVAENIEDHNNDTQFLVIGRKQAPKGRRRAGLSVKDDRAPCRMQRLAEAAST